MPESIPERAATAAVGLSELTGPLDLFYAQLGLSLPPLQEVDGEEIPQPYRQLLVHPNDMTPTLEQYFGREIHLKVLGRRHEGNEYCREVMLYLDGTNQPVEFGANRILLDRFPPAARTAILEEREPLGHIMRDCAVVHSCRPNAFLRLASDRLINDALQISGAQVLYGRHNRLYRPDGQMISEVIEILRPVARA